jgi:hypothetical protein
MRSNLFPQVALIIEPNPSLATPYMHLPSKFEPVCVPTLEQGIVKLSYIRSPALIFISTSFSASKVVHFLETVKNYSTTRLIPLIFVVDLSHKISSLLGTTWGGKLGIAHTLTSAKELDSILERILE